MALEVAIASDFTYLRQISPDFAVELQSVGLFKPDSAARVAIARRYLNYDARSSEFGGRRSNSGGIAGNFAE